MDTILNHRSIRRYSNRDVEQEKINSILKAASRALLDVLNRQGFMNNES